MEILRAVFENRFLSRSLLGVLFPPDQTKAPAAAHAAWRAKHPEAGHGTAPGRNLDRRLKKLALQGYLDRFELRRGRELVYAVTRKADQLLETSQPDLPFPPPDRDRLNANAAHHYIEHTLVVARFRVALEAAVSSLPVVALGGFQREGEGTRATFGEHSINPDAFFVLDPLGRGRLAFFLEADRGTASMRRIERKIRDYAWLLRRPRDYGPIRDAGVASFAVLFVAAKTEKVPDPNPRASAILNRAGELEHGRDRFFVTTEPTYAGLPGQGQFSNLLAAVWLRGDADPERPEHEQRVPIVPVALPRAPS